MMDQNQKVMNLISGCGAVILYAGLAVYMCNGAVGLGTVILSATFLFTLTASVLLLIGMIVRIILYLRRPGEKPAKRQNVFGNGFMSFGALIAGVCTATAVLVDLLFHDETGICFIAQCMMCCGSWLCFILNRIAAKM